MKLKRILVIGVGVAVLLGTAGYWYTFIAGAPQFDPPGMGANTGLTFR